MGGAAWQMNQGSRAAPERSEQPREWRTTAMAWQLRVAAVLVVILVASRVQAQQPCDGALVKSTYRQKSSVGTDWRLAELVDETTYNEIKKGGGVSAKIFGILIGANYNEFQQSFGSLKRVHKEQLRYSQLQNIAWTGIDQNAV